MIFAKTGMEGFRLIMHAIASWNMCHMHVHTVCLKSNIQLKKVIISKRWEKQIYLKTRQVIEIGYGAGRLAGHVVFSYNN